jgi:ribosomal protein L11 methylase PrmA
MPLIAQQLKQGGVILMSGLLLEDFEDVDNQAKKNNLSVSARTAKGNWSCLKMEKSLGLSR